jgi:branched-subunit amino acid aminotransferase/4-amino-4-deoxychorismate lyase
MTTNEWWMLVGLALVLGGGVGGGLAWRVSNAGHAARLRQSNDALQQKFAATIDQLRASQSRTKAELDQTRTDFKRQLAAATDEPRAVAMRAEERLRAAYDELDRLRRAGPPPDSGTAELSDGFAATRPMHDHL